MGFFVNMELTREYFFLFLISVVFVLVKVLVSFLLVELDSVTIVKTRQDLPPPYKIFVSSLLGGGRSKKSKNAEEQKKDPSQSKISIKVEQMHFTAKEKEEFQKLCEYSTEGGATYSMMHTFPHVIGQQFILSLISHPDFPISALGSVHLRSYFEVLQPELLNDFLSSTTRSTFSMEGKYLGCIANQKRGTDLICSLEIVHNETLKPVWKEFIVIYSTKKVKQHDTTAQQILEQYSAYCDFTNIEEDKAKSFEQISATKDDTWRYGMLSGDVNPIHMNEITARLFGQRGRINHGAMILSKALAHVEQRQKIALPLKFGVSFKGPMPCGSTLDVKGTLTTAGDGKNQLKDMDVFVVKSSRPNFCVRAY